VLGTGRYVGYVNSSTLDWLSDTLPDLAPPRIVVMHHVPIDMGAELGDMWTLPHWGAKGFTIDDSPYLSKTHYWQIINMRKFLDAIIGNVEAVLTGHLYQFTVEGYKTPVTGVDVVYQKHFIETDLPADTVYPHTFLQVNTKQAR